MLVPPNPISRPPSLLKRVMDAVTLRPPAARPFTEMGVAGTAVFSGMIATREKSSKWIGQQRYISIADMAVNASIVAAGIHHFVNLIARPGWTFEPADKSSEAKAAAELIEEVIDEMDMPWARVVRRATMFRFYGFGIQEWTAKRREDGSVGLLSIEPRPQHSIERWAVAPDGAVEGVWQRDPQSGRELGLPRKKLLYLVDDAISDSPEGIGIFRHLAEPWERLQAYYALEARGFERDLRGTPIGRIPYAQIREAVRQGEITETQASTLIATVENFVKLQVKQSDTAITLDSIPYYSAAADGAKVAGMPQWGVELLSGGAAGIAEVSAAIIRTQTEMARVLAAEHLMMGEASGNRALGEDKSRNLYLVANAVLGDIAAGVERDVIANICLLNGIPDKLRPKAVPEDVAFQSAQAVAATLAQMAQAGAVLAPDDPVIDDVRSLMGVSASVPTPPELLGMTPPGDEEEQDDEDVTAEDPEEVEEAEEPEEPEDVDKGFDPNQPRDEDGRWADSGTAQAGYDRARDAWAWANARLDSSQGGSLQLANYRDLANIGRKARDAFRAAQGSYEAGDKADGDARFAEATKLMARLRSSADTYGIKLPAKFAKFDPSQPRDDRGRWSETGAGGGAGEGGGVSSEGAAVALLQENIDLSFTTERLMQQLPQQHRDLVLAARQALASGTSTRDQHMKDGKYTPERAALHEEIIARMYSAEAVAAATPPPGQRPELVLTGGRPGAGKTSSLRTANIEVGPPEYIYISADTIQEHLPGYSGDRAGLFNPEAQDIADKAEAFGRRLGVNVVFDATMKTKSSAVARVERYREAGYDVSGYFVHTAPQVSAMRTLDRFAKTGRFVPPEVSLNSMTNEATFDAMTPMLKKWAIFDNNGRAPRLVKRSG